MKQENSSANSNHSSNNNDGGDLVSELRGSIAACNENFDLTVRGDHLQFDLMYRWMRCSINSARPDISVRWFEKLCQYHTERQRSYHTLMHLEEMFLYFDIFKKYQASSSSHEGEGRLLPPILSRQEEDAIVLATFFHDAVYNVHSSTNEEDSATLFQQYMKEFYSNNNSNNNNNNSDESAGLQQLEASVTRLILATKHHVVTMEDPFCLAFFLDLDMAVLGKETNAYLKYASLIRCEYSHVPHDVYCERRAEILENFLTQQQIFGTQAMLEAFEQQARDNLAREIEILRQGQIPGVEQ